MADEVTGTLRATLSVGDVLSDRYQIVAVLGEGGMGLVYRAVHLHLRKVCAIKVLLPELCSNPEVVARFEREAAAASRVDSPHVAAVTDCGRLPDGSFFLVMEYVDGKTLRGVLADGPVERLRAVSILAGLARALAAVHEAGIVHRDVKPENVMLVDRDGDPDFVKLLDFGIARVAAVGSAAPGSSDALTRIGTLLGTPEYMSPEQAVGQPADLRSDLYAVGIIMFEMLTGERPYQGDPVTLLRHHVLSPRPELPREKFAGEHGPLADILRRLLAKVPADRFATAKELALSLEECAARACGEERARQPVDSTSAVATPTAEAVHKSVAMARASASALVTRGAVHVVTLVRWVRANPNAGHALMLGGLVALVLATLLGRAAPQAQSSAGSVQAQGAMPLGPAEAVSVNAADLDASEPVIDAASTDASVPPDPPAEIDPPGRGRGKGHRRLKSPKDWFK